jgi:hypothetical protein
MKKIVENFTNWDKSQSLNEGTRSRIGLLNDDGSVESVYIHWDGYFSGVGEDVKNLLSTKEDVEERLKKGDGSAVGNGFYQERGDSPETWKSLISRNIHTYIKDVSQSWGQFAYIFDPETEMWFGKELRSDDPEHIWTDLTTGDKFDIEERRYVDID